MTTCTSNANPNIPHINDKMLTMSCVDDVLVHVPKTVTLNGQHLPCFKPIPDRCNSLTGKVSVCDIIIHQRDAGNIALNHAFCMRRGDIYFSTDNKDLECGTKNSCGEFSGVTLRLLHSFSKCTNTIAGGVTVARVWARWQWKGVSEIQANEPHCTVFWILAQNINVTKVWNPFASTTVVIMRIKIETCFAVLIRMSLQVLWEGSDPESMFRFC